jgi:dihydropteroate synthase
MSAPRFRPLLQSAGLRPEAALALAGGPLWFDRVAVHEAGRRVEILPAAELPEVARVRLTGTREPICGLDWHRPRLMGILNVTPDSFSDGGRHLEQGGALAQARRMAADGADMIDVGGESTRPGAEPVPAAQEIARIAPVIEAIRRTGAPVPVSIDTRKAEVARVAIAAGADLVNDVSAFSHDADMLNTVRENAVAVCLMHAQGEPATMQVAPAYDDVVLEIYDWFEGLLHRCEAAGLPRARILLDPGIGFGKTLEHNLDLLRNLAIFHGLGCAILVGVSRKRFIGSIGNAPEASARAPGSIAVALEALRQGAQMIRIHDVKETRQAVSLWEALNGFT